jgi:hypothetical protein
VDEPGGQSDEDHLTVAEDGGKAGANPVDCAVPESEIEAENDATEKR